MDYITTRNGLLDVNGRPQRRREMLNNDVCKRNEASEATSNENSDWTSSAVYPKTQEKTLPDPLTNRENDAKLKRRNLSNESDTQSPAEMGDDIIVTTISENDDRNKSLSTRGGNYNLRPNLNSKFSEDFRY